MNKITRCIHMSKRVDFNLLSCHKTRTLVTTRSSSKVQASCVMSRSTTLNIRMIGCSNLKAKGKYASCPKHQRFG